MQADLKISIPGNFVQEREYIVRTILDDFLGFNLEINVFEQLNSYVIRIPGGKDVIIKDSFFSEFNSEGKYLSERYFPSKPQYFGEKIKGFESTPVLYGFPEVEYTDDHILCKADLFASAFFMLTRWEEFVNKERDEHNRFPGRAGIAFRNGFLARPVVNEYAAILEHLLRQGGLIKGSKNRKFTIFPTHDVDHLLYWTKEKNRKILRELTGDLFRRHNPVLVKDKVKSYFSIKGSVENDPFLSFEFLMDRAESAGVKAIFYFFIAGDSVYDPVSYFKTELFRNVVGKISGRGHTIALHPSYSSFLNPSLIKLQLNNLESISGKEITESRQHYLRLSVPYSWRILESCKINTDSTLYYSGNPGFRTGSCYSFKVFDFLERRVTGVVERPLLIMDTCLKKKGHEEAATIITNIRNEVSRYNGEFVFNWHNSSTGWIIGRELTKCFVRELYGE